MQTDQCSNGVDLNPENAGPWKYVSIRYTYKLVRTTDSHSLSFEVLTQLPGLSIITDIICTLLPIAIMRKVQLPLRTQLSISGLMGLGLVCTACSVVRATSLHPKTKDMAYQYSIIAIWGMAEVCIGIIATNFALSRSTYYYFAGREHDSQGSKHPHSHSLRSRAVYTANIEHPYPARTER